MSDRAPWSFIGTPVDASPLGIAQLVTAWSSTDFRPDLARIDVPALIVHGRADRAVPFALSTERTHAALRGSTLASIPGAPHGLNWTHADELNRALIDFLA